MKIVLPRTCPSVLTNKEREDDRQFILYSRIGSKIPMQSGSRSIFNLIPLATLTAGSI